MAKLPSIVPAIFHCSWKGIHISKSLERFAMRVSVTLLQYEHGIIRQVIDVLGE
jgi:hypothetical protein